MKELKMYIDGRFIENQSDKWIDVLNPSTEEVISKMPDGTPEDARAVGISDPLYFSRCFKTHYGVSPSVYLRGKEKEI